MKSSKTQLYVLTGFLGAGKTTVLLKILEHLKGHRVGIIQIWQIRNRWNYFA